MADRGPPPADARRYSTEFMDAQIELAIAASSGDYHAAVEALESGADPNWIDQSNGNSPVLNACKMGHAHIVQLLCSRGLDPNARFSWRSAVDKSRHKNKTPLMLRATPTLWNCLLSLALIQINLMMTALHH